MAVVQITDKDFEEEVLKSKLPALVDFFAEWCGPCKMAGPILDELSNEYKDKIKIFKMDVDENKETPVKYQVMSMPTVVAIKNGKETERKIGFGGKEGYVELINKLLS